MNYSIEWTELIDKGASIQVSDNTVAEPTGAHDDNGGEWWDCSHAFTSDDAIAYAKKYTDEWNVSGYYVYDIANDKIITNDNGERL